MEGLCAVFGLLQRFSEQHRYKLSHGGDDLSPDVYQQRKRWDKHLNERLGQGEQRPLHLSDGLPGLVVGLDILHGQLLERGKSPGNYVEYQRTGGKSKNTLSKSIHGCFGCFRSLFKQPLRLI